MMLKTLNIDNFKNIAQARLELSPKVNGFLGYNGMGKSNLLDAIYMLSFGRSFCGVPDRMLLRRGETFAMVKGEYLRRGMDEDLTLGLSEGRRKSMRRKGKEYVKLSEHIGSFPLVLVSPADVDLVRESAEERRRWMDMVISQSDARYLDALIRYGRGLEQRNRMLREGVTDGMLYASVEAMMEPAAQYIHASRGRWVEQLMPIFERYYRLIADTDERPSLRYVSHLSDGRTLAQWFEESRRRDEAVRHTSVGIHRDDMELLLDDMDMRRTGSQGQCKTFVIALRLAQYEFLREATGMKPLLLLDDIFDKLDARRVERIVRLVDGEQFGQIFITDTNRSHLDEIMNRTGGDYRLWEVNSGVFTPLHHEEA